MSAARPLTPKQQRFVAEYLIDLNATQAAIRAGYSRKCAEVEGPRLLGNVRVAAAVQVGAQKRLNERGLSADRTLEELRRIAFSDVGQLFTDDGSLIPLRELPPEVRTALASVEVVMKNAAAGDDKIDRVLKVKYWDKNKALTDLARHFALLVDRVEVSGDLSLTAKIAAARQRGAQLLAERNGGAE
jgi:phage terminase small subunit